MTIFVQGSNTEMNKNLMNFIGDTHNQMRE